MPPKLQVEESLAFLFTCIEVSGLKLDFKQIGDVAGLNQAAARMRYTRLKKAVESGAFRGATLSQPQGVSAQMIELANPEGRRNAAFGGRSSSVGGSSVYNSARKTPRRRNKNGQQEQDEEFGGTDLQTPAYKSTTRKRKATNTAEDDEVENLFFPDTSTTMQRHKQVKHSESDDEVEEADEEEEDTERADPTPTKSASSRHGSDLLPDGVRGQSGAPIRSFRAPAPSTNDTLSLSPPLSYIDELDEADDNGQVREKSQNNDEDGDETEELEETEDDEAPPTRDCPVHQPQRQSRDRIVVQPTGKKSPIKTESARKKQSAQEAAESAFARRIAAGEVVPDASNIQYFAAAEQAARIGFAGYLGDRTRAVRHSTQNAQNYTTRHNYEQDENYDQEVEGFEDDNRVRSSFSGFAPGMRGSSSPQQPNYVPQRNYNFPQNTNRNGRVQASDFGSLAPANGYGPPRLSTTTVYGHYDTPASILEGFQPPKKTSSSFGILPAKQAPVKSTSTQQRRHGNTMPAHFPAPLPRPASQQSQRRQAQLSPRVNAGGNTQVKAEDDNSQAVAVDATNVTAQFGFGSFPPDTVMGFGSQQDTIPSATTDVSTLTLAAIEAAQGLEALKQGQGHGHADGGEGHDEV